MQPNDTADSTVDHEHTFGDWTRDEACDWWARFCTVDECEWRQVTSDDPTKPQTPWQHAMNRLAGIELGPEGTDHE